MMAALKSSLLLVVLTLAIVLLPVSVDSFCIPASSRPVSFATSKLAAVAAGIQVCDDVYSPETCLELHELALAHADRCESSLVDRLLLSEEDRTPLEYALDYLMRELGDDSQYIEYWSRDEYLNMDAHADIDERYLENEGTIKCPDWSHVLYLKIEEKSPTCILDQRGAWIASGATVELVTVPAVSGRLLRFPGNLMHAVPKPLNRWLSLYDEEDDGDDDDGIERSVLLFNTWSKQPPLEVTRDDVLGVSISSGIDIEGADLEESTPPQQQDFDAPLLQCNPRDSWKDNSIQENDSDSSPSSIRINLMGKRHRRLHPNRNVWLSACGEALESSLQQDSVVSKLKLEED